MIIDIRPQTTAFWRGERPRPLTRPQDWAAALARVGRPLCIVRDGEGYAAAQDGEVSFEARPGALPVAAWSPAQSVAELGDAGFRQTHGVRYAYVAGAMANGIASVELVEAMGRNGMIGFFGAAGLAPDAVEAAIVRLEEGLGDRPWGSNLIHSPYEPGLEDAVVDLYLRRGVRRVSASAWLAMGLPIVRYRVAGIHRGPDGRIVTPNHVFAKVSRREVAEPFLSPPPDAMLSALVGQGHITAEQAALAAQIPMAADLTVEADSGGHTDNRPALTLLPELLALRDRLQGRYADQVRLRVGAAGGIATPWAAAAAFAMGADYILTGSVNQACLEAGTSDTVRRVLAEAEQADVAMAPAADMFEMGVKLQVLRRGTLFAMRAQKLYDLYRAWPDLESIPAAERARIEQQIFRAPLERVWAETQAFWSRRDPGQLDKAARDPRHRMALVFRWYLGLSSRWANRGEVGRELDYQIWCGPSMGAFNAWAKGSIFERWEQRRAAPIALNILHGAAVLMRLASLRSQGVVLAPPFVDLQPRPVAELEEVLQ